MDPNSGLAGGCTKTRTLDPLIKFGGKRSPLNGNFDNFPLRSRIDGKGKSRVVETAKNVGPTLAGEETAAPKSRDPDRPEVRSPQSVLIQHKKSGPPIS